MEKFMEWFKKLLGMGGEGAEPDKKPLWKKLNTMLIIAAGGILLIVVSNAFPSGGDVTENAANPDPVEKQTETSPVRSSSSDIVSMENNQARSLEAVLSQIQGVGDVSVTVNYASTPERNFAVNTSTNNKKTTENDQKGGNRIVTEEDESGQMVLVRENQGNKEEPVVVKEIKPEVRGVIVVAEGADDPETRTSLMNAVSVYLDIPLYKVVVLSKERLWYGVLLVGVALVTAGVFQLFTGYYVNVESAKGLPPGTVEVNKEQAGDTTGVKDDGDKVRRQVKKNEFFVEYRLERDRTRSQQIDLLRDIVNNQNSSEKTREEAQRRLLAISQAIDTEMKLENLIRAENFKDTVVFIQEKSTTVIVQSPVLTPMDKDRLTQITVRVTGQRAEDVVVIPKV